MSETAPARPLDEDARLAALARYQILDTPPEADFDDVARLAAHLCGAPIAGVTFIDERRQWCKALVGLDVSEIPLEQSFCARAIRQPGLFVVEDAAADPRFAENPLVSGSPPVRFYAGVPLVTPEGHALGTLCVIDNVPRRLEPAQRGALLALARQTLRLLELRRRLAELRENAAERQRSEEALRDSEARTRSIIDNMLGGLITVDTSGRIESLNPAAERIFGYARDELIGRHLSVLMPDPPPPSERQAALEAMFRKAIGRVTEWRGRRRNGEVFPFELSMFEFRTARGRHFAGNIRDVSERTEVDRLKKEFVSTVSHELRTPLTSIRGSLSLLSGGVLGELPDEAREVVGIAERNAVRLIGLINDILDLERLEVGRLEMRIAPVPLQQVFDRSLEAVRGMADSHGIRLEARASDAHVEADADRLVQVLVNLLSNAVKFSPAGAAVTLDGDLLEACAEVRVRDRGRGVPAGLQRAIFERFKQVEASDSRDKGGTGLGLAICKAIVEQHHGEIGVLSTEGEGATFWFRVPLAGRAPAAAAPPGGDRLLSSLRDGFGSRTMADVILADGDEAMLGVLARQLLGEGIPVRTAGTGEAAIELARATAPGLLVLDPGLGNPSGFEVVEALRREPRLSVLPLLVYSGRDLDPAERESLRLGQTRFLVKSRATDDEFRDAVRRMLGAGERPT